jgi:hypothetical protein
MKATKCDWCGGDIGPTEVRVKLPYCDQRVAGGMTYHADCYVRIYGKRCLRALIADDYPHGESVGKALDILLRALDPERDHDD